MKVYSAVCVNYSYCYPDYYPDRSVRIVKLFANKESAEQWVSEQEPFGNRDYGNWGHYEVREENVDD